MSPQCEVWAGGGQGLPGEGAVGLGRRRSNVSPLLMCSHLGRLWREPAHRSLPHPAPSKQDSQHSLCSPVSLPGTEKPSVARGAQWRGKKAEQRRDRVLSGVSSRAEARLCCWPRHESPPGPCRRWGPRVLGTQTACGTARDVTGNCL